MANLEDGSQGAAAMPATEAAAIASLLKMAIMNVWKARREQ